MSSIMGIKLKNVEFFSSYNNVNNGFNADMYLGNSKILYCYNDGIGSITNYELVKGKKNLKKLFLIIESYLNANNIQYSSKNKVQKFLEELFLLKDYELVFKKMIKENSNGVLILFYKEDTKVLYKSDTINEETLKKFMNKNCYSKYKIFKTINDFDISC